MTAKQIAFEAHAGQFRRDGKTPYIYHPAAVVQKLRGEAQDVHDTAWLHDVLEDTKLTTNDLRAKGVCIAVVEAVQVLTKKEGGDYAVYLALVKRNSIARKVKIADMLANLSDSPTDKQIVKYAKGLIYLLE